MPRHGRIDAAGAVHHLIVRGIERQSIFYDDTDKVRFLERLGTVIGEGKSLCYAFALLSNHVHLLLRTGTIPVASLMRRLLTGYVVSFNKRHKRSGHLFQNRYKSILCEGTPLGTYIKLSYSLTRPVSDATIPSCQDMAESMLPVPFITSF